MYAQSADTELQREVAEKLANEAVKRTLKHRILEKKKWNYGNDVF